MIMHETPLGEETLAAAGVGATVTEAPGYPSPASEPQKPASGFASADPAAAVAGAEVRVSVNFRSGAKHQDLLTISGAENGTFTSGGGEAIVFAYDRSTGVLSLSGTASAGAYDEAFEAVRFAIAGDDPDDGGAAASRTIAYSIFDGAAYSDLLEAGVAVVAVNDAPTLEILGTDAARLGGEAVVDTSSGSDREVSMTGLAGGGYLMTWTHSANMGGDPSVIRAQRFDPSGATVGGRITLASSAGSSAFNSASAAFADGGFVITWESSTGLNAQRYSASGAKLGGQIVVSADNNNQEVEPTVAVLADGGFVVSWHAVFKDGSGQAVLARRYDSAGVAQGAAVQVNSFTANDQHFAAAAGLADGGYVIAWTSWQQDAPGAGIYGQRFNAAGIAQGGEFRINTAIAGNQKDPSIAALADGGFVISWSSTGPGHNDPTHIYAQRFDAAGNATGGEIKVSVVGGVEPAVTALADGGFAIAWQAGEIYTRRYGPDGQPAGPEAQVNTHGMGSQWHPAVAGLAGGDFVVGWAHLNLGEGHSGVFQQRYTDGLAVEEGVALPLNGRIGLDDVDAGTGSITVTLSVDQGRLFYTLLQDNAAVATGNGTMSLRITGSLADVQAFLGGDTLLGYQIDSDAPPANAVLTVRVEDDGGKGGDPLAVEKVLVIGIVPLNDKPVLGAAASTTLAFTEGDGPLALMQGVTVSDPDLPANFRDGGFQLMVDGSTGALQLREGSAFTLTADLQGGYVVGHPTGGASLAYLTGIGTSTIFATFRSVTMTPTLTSDLIDDFVFTDSSDNPAAGNRTATLAFFDGQNLGVGISPTAFATQTITVTPVNDAPTVDWANGFGYEDMARAQVLMVGLDADSTSLSYTLVSLPEHGTLYSAATGGVALSVGSTIPVNAQGRGVAYFQPDLNWNGNTAFTFNVSDGSLSSPTQTATIAIRATNDAPVFSGVATLNAVEQTQVVLAPGITVSDLELDPRNGGAGNYSGTTLTVGGSIPSTPGDTFALVAGPGFTIVGNDLRAGGLTFATITGNANGKLTIAFNGAQTIPTTALVNEVLQAVRYTNTSDSAPASYSIALVLNDGGTDESQGYPGAASGSRSITVTMTGVNDAPTSTLLGGDVATWTEGETTRLLDPTGNATIADIDSANFAGGSLTVAIGAGRVSAQDRLVLTATGNVTFTATTVSVGGTQIATYTGGGAGGGPLVFSFDSDATPAAVQALVRAIGYTNSGGDVPTAGNRTIDWTLVDGDGTANSGTDRL
ncbi:MAG TPA: Ig-like domain-containing protein, partial [Allosphingosinicella sp.]